ncbi:MAG TPA: VWA domain-containing protein [Gemmatimonadaceae bacterium]|nr:VWA domain-containing protein [Gemmatimonadaceae bacterium]
MRSLFDMPLALAAIPVLVAGVVTLALYAWRRRRARLARLATEPLVARLVPPGSACVPRARVILLGLAALFAGLAFSGPRWGLEAAVVRSSGADIVLAIDASLSMLATDEKPSRLEEVKQEARRLLAASPGDRIGLIAFAGRSYILTPLTVDRGALELFLDNLDPSIVGQAGSSLARTIRQGTDLLVSTQSGSDRALVILSDGEAFEEVDDVKAAAKRAADAGVTVIAIGVGTEAGATIPVRTSTGVSLKRDADGQIVVTRYHPEMLRAAITDDGLFVPAAATDKAARARRALDALRQVQHVSRTAENRRAQFQLFLLPALLCVLADTLLAERRGRRRGAAVAATAASALLLLVALPRAAHADPEHDGDRLFRAGRYGDAAAAYRDALRHAARSPRLLYNYGTALLAAGRRGEAIDALRESTQARDADIRYRALFNLGLAYLQRARGAQGDSADADFAAARDAYKQALRMRPGALDAKWNYELSLRPRRSGGGGGGGAPQNASPSNNAPPAPQPAPRPQGGLGQQQAEQLLNSAAREEQEVQEKQQRANRPTRPPGGKDW